MYNVVMLETLFIPHIIAIRVGCCRPLLPYTKEDDPNAYHPF